MPSFDEAFPDLYKQDRTKMVEWSVEAGRLAIDAAARRIMDIRALLDIDYDSVKQRGLAQTKRDIEGLIRGTAGPEALFSSTANLMVVRSEYGGDCPPEWSICFEVATLKGIE